MGCEENLWQSKLNLNQNDLNQGIKTYSSNFVSIQQIIRNYMSFKRLEMNTRRRIKTWWKNVWHAQNTLFQLKRGKGKENCKDFYAVNIQRSMHALKDSNQPFVFLPEISAFLTFKSCFCAFFNGALVDFIISSLYALNIKDNTH